MTHHGIAESHIRIRTFPDNSCVSVDIASRKPFDTDFDWDYFQRTFGMTTPAARTA